MLKVLLVEDENLIRRGLQYKMDWTEVNCVVVGEAATGQEGLTQIKALRPDIVITDIRMPDMDGLEVLEQFSDLPQEVPTIIISARDRESEKVKALDMGADDYVVKPFDPRELLARIRTVLRRASDKGQAAAQSDIRRFAGWTLNVRSRELSQGDERIALSDAMYRLLLVFLDEPFAVLSREYLLRQTQGRDADVFDRSVDIQVSRLRGVLKDTGTSKIIKTVRGGGYMLSVDVEHDA